MWEFDRVELGSAKKTVRETWYFLDWMKEFVVENVDVQQLVSEVFLSVAQNVVEVKRFTATPQSAPWHCEGITVDVHVKRMLGTVQAIVQGADILSIEEFSREKLLHDGLSELQEVIREHAGFFLAYAFVHDIAKPEVVFLEAVKGSKGEREGFVSARRNGLKDEEQIQHYLKLFRSFSVKYPNLSQEELLAKFYDTYEIQVHYDQHDRIGSGDRFASVREAIALEFRLATDHIDLLRLLTKRHMHTMASFMHGTNPEKYQFFVQQAEKDGYDADDYLDLALGCLFLDVTTGSLAYEDGSFFVQYQPVLNCLHSELMARVGRGERRQERREKKIKAKRKRVFDKVGLSGEAIFSLLQVPFGPGRADVVRMITDAVDGKGDISGFDLYAEELEKRVVQARKMLRDE